MKIRFPAWGVLAALIVVCASAIFFVMRQRLRPEPAAAMLARFPAENTSIVSVDFRALRQSGLLRMLAGAGTPQEPEYRTFVEQTGFNYQEDLDLALVGFRGEDIFYLLRGRFDWRNLRAYAQRQNGTCLNTFCRMPGSTPQRWISFFPIQQDLMALAVSKDPYGADTLRLPGKPPFSGDVPIQPAWALVSAAAVRNSAALPPGVRLLLDPLRDADRILVSLGPRDGAAELMLDVTCRTAGEAGALAARLRTVGEALRELGKQKLAGELAAVLAGGVFTSQERRVTARWPIERKFLESLAAGGGAL